MPTDFSFVTPEGWEALRSKFDGAQKKLQQKVEKKETTPEFGRRLTDLMEKKYQHWSSGKGMKEKENQTALQEKEKATRRASAMRRLAYLGRQSTIDIADAALKGEFSNGLDFNTANFLKVLEMNGTNVAEFFQVLAERITDPDFFDAVSRDAGLMPGQMAGLLSKKFGDWGFEKEVRPVVDAARGAVRQQPAAPAAPATTPAVPGESLSADEPPAATQPASTAVNAPSTSGLVEPRAWPQNVKVPPPSQSGPAYDCYFRFIPPGEKAPSAGIAKGLNQTDAVSFVHYLQGLGYSPQRSIPLKNFAKESPESAAFVSRVTGAPASPGAPAAKPAAPAAQAPAAPAAAKPAVPPAPAAMQPKPGHSGTVPGETGQIDAPDPADPKTYRWAIKYKLKSGFITDPGSVDLTGAQMAEQLKEYQRMGVEVLELKKMSIVNQASIEVSDGDLRFAADGAPEEKFKAGTPIIFKEDVNLKFDALSARGQIKKNMTGKIKKVEDNDYLIDIAGQFYRLPRLVAEHVMDVFAAVVIPNEEQESAAEPQTQADGQAAQPQAPGAQPQAAPASAPSASPAPATAQARFEAAGMPRSAKLIDSTCTCAQRRQSSIDMPGLRRY